MRHDAVSFAEPRMPRLLPERPAGRHLPGTDARADSRTPRSFDAARLRDARGPRGRARRGRGPRDLHRRFRRLRVRRQEPRAPGARCDRVEGRRRGHPGQHLESDRRCRASGGGHGGADARRIADRRAHNVRDRGGVRRGGERRRDLPGPPVLPRWRHGDCQDPGDHCPRRETAIHARGGTPAIPHPQSERPRGGRET